MMVKSAQFRADQKRFTQILKPPLAAPMPSSAERPEKSGGECKKLRRQASAAGIAREGSSPLFRLDPLRLPVSFTAADPSADGGSREIGVSREGIELRRSIRGVQMRVHLPYEEFEGVAVRVIAAGGEPVIFLSLEHQDDALSVLLLATEDSDEAAASARRWSHVTGMPILVAGADGNLHSPAVARKASTESSPRRKRRSALRDRRTSVRLRIQRTNRLIEENLYTGEREIIARD